jgi:hypothetical protein
MFKNILKALILIVLMIVYALLAGVVLALRYIQKPLLWVTDKLDKLIQKINFK